MKKRAFRAVTITVSLLLALAVPAQASPVQIGEVIQVVTGSQRNGGQNATVALRYIAEDDRATAGTTTTTTSASTSANGDATTSSGNTVSVQDPGATIQTEVTEDIGVEQCECGGFEVPVAGFPKWPFIPLVGLICVTGICSKDKCTPGPNQDENCQDIPVCTNCNQIPEPASLLLFGSGLTALGASLRRRRRAQTDNVEDRAATISGS